jgi:hypothetical protein
MRRVVTGMINGSVAEAKTGLSPEWDRWFDEAFTDLIINDDDLVREEFDALVGASWPNHPPPAPPPAASPAAAPDPSPERRPTSPSEGSGRADSTEPRPPPT